MASFFRTYRVKKDGERVDGVFAMAFIHNFDYHLTHISIYKDGMIDCWGQVDLEEFQRKVRWGWVVTQPPEGAQVSLSFLARFKAVDASYWVDPEEFIKEVADEIEGLNGRPRKADLCARALKEYEDSPSASTREALRAAYEAVPEHLRIFVLGDMDSKDHAIRAILFPEEYPGDEED